MSGGGHGSHDDEPHEEHEEHVNHEAWVIPYADLLTLLMAMFIALFAMSKVDVEKFKQFALGMNQAFSGHDLNTGVFADPTGSGLQPGIGSGETGLPGDGGKLGTDRNRGAQVLGQLLSQLEKTQAVRDSEKASLEGVRKQISERAEQLGISKDLQLEMQERGLVVRIITDKVLFDSADATLRPEGAAVLGVVAQALGGLENTLLVEGHTDDRVIATDKFPSNWELSTARASAVVRELQALGVAPDRLRPTGYADLHPLVPNTSEANRARNRRVEIVVQSKFVDQVLQDAGATDEPLPDRTTPPIDTSPRITPNIDDIVGDLSRG